MKRSSQESGAAIREAAERLSAFLAVFLLLLVRAQGQGTAFTYQGRLEDGGRPATGEYDIQFQAFDRELPPDVGFISGAQVRKVGVTNGVFTTVLDFGDLFITGATFYLELSVRPAGSAGALEKLAPRQRITPTPYAIRAGGLTGPLPANQLPVGVLMTDGARNLQSVIRATDSANVFGGDGSALTGVKAAAVGSRGEVRVQQALFRRLPTSERGEYENYGAYGVLAGDFNGDGMTDLIGCLSGVGAATLHTNAGGGRLVRAVTGDLAGLHFGPKQAVTGRFNNDGSLDLAFWREAEKKIHIYTNSSNGDLRGMTSIAITNVTALAAIDVNMDALTDLAVAQTVDNVSRVRIYLNTGTAMVAGASLPLPSAASDIVAGDFESTGQPDLLVACRDANEIRLFINNDGGFATHLAIPAVRPRALALGALNWFGQGFTYVSEPGTVDGKPEESMIRSMGKNGDGTYKATPTRLPVGIDVSDWWVRLAVEDYNGDGINDVLATVLFFGKAARAVRYDSVFDSLEHRRVLEWDEPAFGDVEVAEFDGNIGPDLGTSVVGGVAVWVPVGAGLTSGIDAQFNSRVDVLGRLSAISGMTVAGGLDVAGGARFSGAASADQWSVTGSLKVPGSSTLSDVVIEGDALFGTRTRQMVNLLGTGYGIGVQPETFYFRAGAGPNTGFAWFLGGSHSNAIAHPGDQGFRLMRLDGDALTVEAGAGALTLGTGTQIVGGSINFRRFGDKAQGFDVRLENDAPGRLLLRGNLGFGTQTRQMLNLWGGEYGIGVQSSAVYFRSGADFYWFKGGTHSDVNGDPGNGGPALMKLSREGRIGLGNDSPAYPIDVRSAVGVARLVSTNNGFGSVLVLQNTTPLASPGYYGAINFESATTTAGQIGYLSNDQMTFRVGGHQRMVIDAAGNVGITGTFSQASDRNVKQDVEPVDPEAVLSKVAELPIAEWSYRHDPAIRHVGPMAQDFHAAFGLGADDKHIATVDADGVALAAIQGLNRQLEAVRRENAELRERLERLERRLTGGTER